MSSTSDTRDPRAGLLAQLDHYRQSWAAGLFAYHGYNGLDEHQHLDLIERFVSMTPACFARTTLAGHVTGSAMVTNAALDKVLLTHHRKLDKWLQLGGHADDDIHPESIALREAKEESGLQELKLLRFERGLSPWHDEPTPFDLDVHLIPERKEVPAHYHYDVRFLIIADDAAPIACSDESNDLRWFSVEQAHGCTKEQSMHRQFAKLAFLRGKVTFC